MSSGYPHLVGNTGIIGRDNRLYPLKMNKKYKSFLEALDCERKSKVHACAYLYSEFQVILKFASA